MDQKCAREFLSHALRVVGVDHGHAHIRDHAALLEPMAHALKDPDPVHAEQIQVHRHVERPVAVRLTRHLSIPRKARIVERVDRVPVNMSLVPTSVRLQPDVEPRHMPH